MKKVNTICNFCLQKYQSSNLQKSTINLCQICFNKAIKTSSFKVSSPNGDLYQLYLVRKSFQPIKSCGSITNIQQDFLDQIDQMQDDQIKTTIGKWMHISFTINKVKELTQQKVQRIKEILLKQKQSLFMFQIETAKQLQKQFNIQKHLQSLQSNKSNKSNSKKVLSMEVIEQQQSLDNKNCQNIKILQNYNMNDNIQTSYFNEQNNNTLNLKTQNQEIKDKINIQQKNLQNNENSQLPFQSSKIIKTKRSIKSNQKQNSKSKSNIQSDKNVPALDQFYYQDMLWNWKKGPSFHLGNKSAFKSQNLIDNQKSQFWNKISCLKAKIYTYLINQGKTSPALIKIVTQNTCEAVQTTICLNKCIQLVSYKLQGIDFECYLKMLDWKGVDILKLVKVSLNDQNGKILLQFIKKQDLKIQSLVLTNNKLSEQFVKNLSQIQLSSLKSVYLSKNQIHSYKVKTQLKQMKERFVLYL